MEASVTAVATQRKPAQLSGNQPEITSGQRSELSIGQAMGLDLLDLLSAAVLIHTVEKDGALVVLAVRRDKLCTQQVEVHEAQVEVYKAYVDLHEAYVEL